VQRTTTSIVIEMQADQRSRSLAVNFSRALHS
jgi:hypothetical protein